MYLQTERQLARAICKRFHSNNPLEIAEQLGYIVLSVPLVEVRGFHQKIKRRHIIYLNEALSESEAQFVCAHELGHALLHNQINRLFLDSSTYFIGRKFELSADRFAVHLLHTDEEVEELTRVYQYTTPQIAKMWGISEALVEDRVNHTDLR